MTEARRWGRQHPHTRTFVGREQELARLLTAFDAAAAGAGSLVLLAGEPGIGKTALCARFATHVAERGGQVLTGHCYEPGSLSLPYLPFLQVLRAHVLSLDAEALVRQAGSHVPELAHIVPEIGERLATVPARVSPTDPEEARYRLFQAVTEFLRAAATEQPLVLMLEDLHDADKGTLDLLVHLARHLDGSRLLLAGTYRDVEVDRAHPLSSALAELRRATPFERIPLRGLAPDEVQQLADGITDGHVAPALAAAVHRQTEGNPLFAQEVVRYLLEEGHLRDAGTGAGADFDHIITRIPEGLRDVIGKRLSRLSPACNRMLGVAAVIGREFALDTLQAVAGMTEDVLLDALEEAAHAAVLEEQAGPRQVRYRFTHALFRQALYEELIAPRRLRLHQQIARALEAQYADRLDDHAAELAEHYSHSTHPDDLAKAVAYGEQAARRALAVYAYGEAVRLLEQALQVQDALDPDDQMKRCDLLLALGTALNMAGAPLRTVDEVAPEALRLAQVLKDEERASQACTLALDALWRYGAAITVALPHYRTWAQQADRYAQDGTVERVAADVALAEVEYNAWGWVKLDALQQRALTLARVLGEPEMLGRAAAHRLRGGFAPQHQDERLRLAEECLQWPHDGMTPGTRASLLWNSARILLDQGRRREAEAVWEQVHALAARTEEPYALMLSYWAEGILATVDGRLDDTLAAGERLRARGDELGVRLMGREFARQLTVVPLIRIGQAAEALALLDSDPRPNLGSLRSLTLAHLGQDEEARAVLRAWMDRFPSNGEASSAVTTPLIALLEAAVLLGEREAAAELASQLVPAAHLALGGGSMTLTVVARLLGAAAALLGRAVEAQSYYEQALDVAGKVRFRPEVALTHLALAELLGEAGPHPDRPGLRPTGHTPSPNPGRGGATVEAIGHLDLAIPELRDMKMMPALERALALRVRLAGNAGDSAAAPAYPDGLSEREVEVLRLIAAGHTNQAIAEQLVLSVRTVERHSVNIYTKIGARGRADAVAYALRRGLTAAD